jgi:hypothetical protein
MTKQQTWKPKYGANKFRASASYRGRQIEVRMINPDTSRGVPTSGFRYLLHSSFDKVKQPTPVTGNYVPSKFEVLGFGCRVAFTLEIVKGARHSSVEITELACEQGVKSSLPLALFRKLALKASTFTGYLLPPLFSYSPSPSFTIKAGEKGALEIMGSGSIPVEVLNDLHDPEQEVTDKLKRVWDLYNRAPEGMKYSKVAEGFGYSPGSKSGLEWAHKWVKRARKEFAPQQVRKTRQRRGK